MAIEGTKDDAGRDQQRREDYRRRKFHSTVMLAEAVSENPLSPIHSKSNFPLSVATVKNEMNGLAAVAGKQIGAENLLAVEAAGEARDDVARHQLRPTRCGDSRSP